MSSESRSIAQSVDDEHAAGLLSDVYSHELPPVLEDLVMEYQELKVSRPPFMWKWVHKLAPQNTLPCVPEEYRDAVPIDKTLLILYVTLLDDVLEKRRDVATFDVVASIPFSRRSRDWDASKCDKAYVEFTQCVWDTVETRIARAPAYETYLDLFRYDIKQAINAIEYSDLVIQHPELATVHDLEQYESHNMVMYAYADIDLMHSPTEVQSDQAVLREAIWHAQQMARIGNWLSTWRRELAEGDCSSGVVVYALENDIISHSDVSVDESETERSTELLIEAIEDAGVEHVFFQRWDRHYEIVVDLNTELTTMDLTPFIEGLEEVLRYHLASTGLK